MQNFIELNVVANVLAFLGKKFVYSSAVPISTPLPVSHPDAPLASIIACGASTPQAYKPLFIISEWQKVQKYSKID